MTSRAQMEALGLVIVVLLVSLAMLFAIIFIVKDDDESPTTPIKQKETASNFLSAMILTNVPSCKNLTMHDLYIDCAEGSIIDCNASGAPNSCYRINQTIPFMLNNTLDVWGKSYVFDAYTSSSGITYTVSHFESGECEERSRGFSYLPTSVGTLFFTLDICS